MSGNSFPILDLGSSNSTYQKGASASTLGGQSGVGASLVTNPGQWTLVHTPAAAAQPTASKAAVAATRHVITSLVATVAPGATAQGPVLVHIRDGATGAGTIMWSGYLQAPANGFASLSSGPINVIGTANTALTVEFAAATAANVVGSVAATGYSVT